MIEQLAGFTCFNLLLHVLQLTEVLNFEPICLLKNDSYQTKLLMSHGQLFMAEKMIEK